MATKKPPSPFRPDDHAALADAYEKAAKDEGANDPLAGAVRREAMQFFARITAALSTGHIEPAVSSAPPVAPGSPLRASSAEAFAKLKPGEFEDPAQRFEARDGALIGARTLPNGLVALVAHKRAGSNMPGDVFGEKPADAYALVVDGVATLRDPESLKVIRSPRG